MSFVSASRASHVQQSPAPCGADFAAATFLALVIDRAGPRRISIAGDLISMGAVALVPVLHAAQALPLGLLWRGEGGLKNI
jgi:hypothetical protein